MLRAGAAVNATEMGSTALHALSHSGDISLVSELCNVRADVDARDSQSTTPIILAAMKGHTDVVRMLLAEAAQVDFRDKRLDRTPAGGVHGPRCNGLRACRGQRGHQRGQRLGQHRPSRSELREPSLGGE
mmetsp:Transcript_45336/g.102357  ORF Transcript_45336/g.102357 Transcript_45336/m.102357 type:complete len:130 (-) Transcript_45336:214-603(-)